MLPRIFGVLIGLAGLVLAGFAVLGFVNARDMSHLIGMVSDASDSTQEASRWLRHWHLATWLMLVSGLGLAVAGVGLFLRRKGSLLLLASVAGALALQDLVMWAGGWVRYAFEVPEPAEIALLLFVAAFAVVAYQRWHRVEPS